MRVWSELNGHLEKVAAASGVPQQEGEPDRIETRFHIPRNGERRVIDLRGVGKRSLRKVEFWYDTAGALRGRADVTVFGMK